MCNLVSCADSQLAAVEAGAVPCLRQLAKLGVPEIEVNLAFGLRRFWDLWDLKGNFAHQNYHTSPTFASVFLGMAQLGYFAPQTVDSLSTIETVGYKTTKQNLQDRYHTSVYFVRGFVFFLLGCRFYFMLTLSLRCSAIATQKEVGRVRVA